MLHIYLPIAQMSVNGGLILGMGAAVGYLSGMFGVGGGFLMTPLLIFAGIPPAIAISTGANQLVATSMSGFMAQWRRGNVDLRMGIILLVGGGIGSVFGVLLVKYLRQLGQFDLTITLSYVGLLGVVGLLMLIESLRALGIARREPGTTVTRRRTQHSWIHGLPLKMRFPRSKLYASIIPPFVLGAVVGVLSAMMGVGGGFIMVPAMIYLLRMPTTVAIGTSLFQIMFVMAAVTILQAVNNETVDLYLAVLLMVGGVVGAQWGANFGRKMRPEQLRVLLALLVLAVAIRLLVGLLIQPSELYTLNLALGAR